MTDVNGFIPVTIAPGMTPVPRKLWQDLFNADRLALPEQSPAWIDCLCATGDYQDASCQYDIGQQQLILPMVTRKGRPAWLSSAASMPGAWGMGGLLSRQTVQPDEVALVMQDLISLPHFRVSIRPNPLLDKLWLDAAPPTVLKMPRNGHILDLSGGFDHIWSKKFHTRTRRHVRKAEQSGLTVECDTAGKLIPLFYQLYELSVDRWAQQRHEPLWLARYRARRRDPIEKLQLIAERMGEACQTWVASQGGKPAAAIIVLRGAHSAHYTRGAMDKELAGPSRANFLLHRLAIEDAIRSGFRYYHMGETGQNASLAEFKESFGAEPYPYHVYRIEKLPLTRLNKRLRGMVKRMLGYKNAPSGGGTAPGLLPD